MRVATLHGEYPGEIMNGRGETQISEFSAGDGGFMETLESQNNYPVTDRVAALHVIRGIGERR